MAMASPARRRRSRACSTASISTPASPSISTSSPQTRDIVRHFAALVQERKASRPAAVDMRASINPIGGMAAAGAQPTSPGAILRKRFAGMSASSRARAFAGPFAAADGRIVHNAGGSEAQELAFALASAVAYLRALEASGIALDAARGMIYFRLAADADQFLTIAKFRALRRLWARVEEACGLDAEARLRLRRDRLADDDAARSVGEHAAHHHRGVLRRRRRRRRHHGAAVHRRARPARPLRAPHRAQHAACCCSRKPTSPRSPIRPRAPAASRT